MTTVVNVDGAPSLARQATWLLVAKTIGFALTFALPLVLVRTLTQHDFGLYKQAFLVVVTAVTILPLGFGMTAFYFLPREPERQGSVVLHILLVHSAIGAIVAAGSARGRLDRFSKSFLSRDAKSGPPQS
jgi:O-antigen/teichoic acid export membrane protein